MNEAPSWYKDPEMALIEMAMGGKVGSGWKDVFAWNPTRHGSGWKDVFAWNPTRHGNKAVSGSGVVQSNDNSKIYAYLSDINSARSGGRITTAMARGITDKFEKEYESECNCPGKRTKYGYIKKCDCRDDINNPRVLKRNANPARFEKEQQDRKKIRREVAGFGKKGGKIVYDKSWYDDADDLYRSGVSIFAKAAL